MTVLLRRQPFTADERKMIIESVMTGNCPELDDISIEIAEKLPELLRLVGLSDTSDNRRRLIDLVLARWGQPKHRKSRSYLKLRG